MRTVDWVDDVGRKFRSLLPDDAGDEQAPLGVPVGPPDLSGLDLPLATEVRLNNAFFERGILTREDAVKRSREFIAVVQEAYRADALALQRLFLNEV